MTSLLPVDWHPALLCAVGAALVAYGWLTRLPAFRVTRGQRWCAVGAALALLAAYWWPLGDLAAHVSLAALVLQRLVVLLCVAPLLVSSLPQELVARATRPAALDAVAAACSKPAIAVLVVTVLGTASLVPAVVAWGA